MTTPPVGGAGGTGSVPEAPPTCYRHTDRETWIRCQRCERPICPDCMNSAAVGFHCPTCVKEGSRTTRQARTPYGGTRVTNPGVTSISLIVLNVLVWVGVVASGGRDGSFFEQLALLPQTTSYVFADGTTLTVEGVSGGAFWQVLTSAFTHVSITHIGFNMLALWFLGPQLEMVLGRVRFLALYLLSGLAGSAAVMWFSSANGQTIGASGAVFGLMGALVVIALKVGSSPQQIVLWIGINLLITFTVPGISWQGHLGGLLGGVLLAAVLVFAPRQRRALYQWTGMATIGALSLGLILLRAAQLS